MTVDGRSKEVRVVTNSRLQEIQFRHALAIMVGPPVLAVLLCVCLPSWKPGIPEISCLCLMYMIAGYGVDIGLHRYFTHRSFACGKGLETVLAVAGMMAAPGTLLSWVATHRQHHENSDGSDDPHSPYVDGARSLVGFWHAHAGWLFYGAIANPLHYAPDIVRDKLLMRLNRLYVVWVFVGYAVPFGIGLTAYGTMTGALSCLLWGGAIRMLVEHHVLLSINSICHVFGTQSYKTRDYSRNNYILAIPSLGEAWHNNHHAFPGSAFYGHRWWEIDLGGYLIRALRAFHLVWDVKAPMMEAGEQ